jgi:hypothetical protein
MLVQCVEQNVVERGQPLLERERLVALRGAGEETVLIEGEVVECRVQVGGIVKVGGERVFVDAGLCADGGDGRRVGVRAVQGQGGVDELLAFGKGVGVGNGRRGVGRDIGGGYCSGGRGA